MGTTIFMPHSTLTVVISQFAGKMFMQQNSRDLKFLRMIKFKPGLDAYRLQFFKAVADNLRPTLVKDRFSTLYIPFPSSDISAFNNMGKPLSLLIQFNGAGQNRFLQLQVVLINFCQVFI